MDNSKGWGMENGKYGSISLTKKGTFVQRSEGYEGVNLMLIWEKKHCRQRTHPGRGSVCLAGSRKSKGTCDSAVGWVSRGGAEGVWAAVSARGRPLYLLRAPLMANGSTAWSQTSLIGNLL